MKSKTLSRRDFVNLNGRLILKFRIQQVERRWDENGCNSSGSPGIEWGYCERLFPLPNVWLGVTAENQKMADQRIPILLDTPAVHRFVSVEPMLGAVNLDFYCQFEHEENEGYGVEALKGLDWVICGGESGRNARPINPEWVYVERKAVNHE